ncbi:MAG: sugar kinase [Candidatus Omnitrophica bacterium]|nr:sugar kinase [Candidatus Omnitrophota bacterium]
MKKNRILAVGSVALDSVKTPFGEVTNALGGSVSYFAASARFFSKVALVGVVGRDFPEKYWDKIRSLGVDTACLERKEGKTFHWRGFYGDDLNHAKTLKTELNVFQSFRPCIPRAYRSDRFVFLANIDPDIQREVLGQMGRPHLTACDTMNYWIAHKRPSLMSLLKKVHVFLCNDGEARELSGERSLLKAAKWVLSRGPSLLVIKKGEHGVLCFSKNFTFLAPAFLLEDVFDPTGAGDSFAGGFVGYLVSCRRFSEKAVRKAIVYGSVLASYNVESFSLDRLSRLKRPEIEKRYRQFREMTRF